MYARKSYFVTKKVKERSKKALAECAKVRKNGLKVGKLRKNHKNTPYTHKHKKKPPCEDRVTYIHI